MALQVAIKIYGPTTSDVRIRRGVALPAENLAIFPANLDIIRTLMIKKISQKTPNKVATGEESKNPATASKRRLQQLTALHTKNTH